jgi:hypothetical protein
VDRRRDRKMGVPWNGGIKMERREKEKRRMCGDGSGGSYLWRLSNVKGYIH